MKFEHKGNWAKQIAESAQKNEGAIPAILDSIIISYKDTHDKAKFDKIVDELSKLLKRAKFITYRDLYEELQGWRYQDKDIKEILNAVEKKSGIKNNMVESAQINETRSYKVTVKLEVPDKMNNRDIEDYIENKVDNSNFGVYVLDVTAERA